MGVVRFKGFRLAWALAALSFAGHCGTDGSGIKLPPGFRLTVYTDQTPGHAPSPSAMTVPCTSVL